MAAKKPETITWSEVCKKVEMGDGLYSTCREKVDGYDAGGFRGGALDEVPGPDPTTAPGFDKAVSSSALAIPEPPSKDALRQYPPGYGQEQEFMGMPLSKILMYGGVAALLWLWFGRKTQTVVGTETVETTAPAPDVTSTQAA